MTLFNESTVESAALSWLTSLGWRVAHGPDIAPGVPGAQRADYCQVVLERWLRDALAHLNPNLPAAALDDAFQKLTHPEGATLEVRIRSSYPSTGRFGALRRWGHPSGLRKTLALFKIG